MTAKQPVEFPEAKDFQQQLRASLGILSHLKDREIIEVEGKPTIHCELYRHSTDSPTVLFLPGLGTYVELYAALLSRLRDLGFNVVGVDPRGHGYSGGERGFCRIREIIADLQRVMERLQREFSGQLSIFGYSGGAIAALALAERDPRIESVLCGTLLLSELAPDLRHGLGWHWTRGSARLFPWMKLPLKAFVDFEALLDGHPAAPLISKDPKLIYDYPLATLASMFSQRAGILRHHYPFRLGILQGEQDEVLSATYAHRVVSRSKQRIDLMLLPGEGHMLPWDNPKLMAEYAGRWLHGEWEPKS